MEDKIPPTRQWFDCDPEVDDTVTFYSRMFGDSRVVIIPKSQFEFSETPTTFVLTLKNEK